VSRSAVGVLALAVLLVGCQFNEGGIASTDDGGLTPDAAVADGAAVADAQVTDARVTDASDVDAPSIDAAPPVPDAAVPDAAVPDANVPDAGPGPIVEDVVHLPVGAEFSDHGNLVLGTGIINTTNLTIGGAAPPADVTFDTVAQDPSGPELAVLHVETLTISGGATVTVRGARPLVIVASGTIVIAGTLDSGAERDIPGAGGSGAGAGMGAGSDGEHRGSFSDSGGGGAGYGTAGAAGGLATCGAACTDAPGGVAGPLYGMAALPELRGGSGGGAAVDCVSDAAGAGGGAVQLYSGVSITIDGGINAGGGGGGRGLACGGNWGAAAGGGSGGAIFLQAPSITNNGLLISHGGGGGGSAGDSNAGSPGDDGTLTTSTPQGGAGGGGSFSRAGGNGGAAAAPQAGGNAGNSGNGGGGGAAVGRIRVITSSGTYVDTGSVSPPASVGTY